MYILFLNFIKKNLILLYHTEQLTDGGHEEICDKNVGHGTEMVGNHWVRGKVILKAHAKFHWNRSILRWLKVEGTEMS